jgi:hypothetical protein
MQAGGGFVPDPDFSSPASTDARNPRGQTMTLQLVVLQPLIALIAGILILVIPRLLNVLVAVYLILVGLLGLWPHLVR